ncbi:hypothetical protein PGT21_024026 [Puccinia graminis f. sp. tritici]|uniref:Secreted protein n=1 Tax=Puccinia graminis f. sp. tritici TaxID=56615 RepID=A0A5B0NCW9_PUCGR|nr:hypothetical protein PGT21_024026 [Puccinia graminis f. sp. tritici]KAA1095921.1 hypothetical protein PGTUg99_035592 [Puccinia graminis f. sp. tritici]
MLLTKILVSLQILHFYVAPAHSSLLAKHLVKRTDEILDSFAHSTLHGEPEAMINLALTEKVDNSQVHSIKHEFPFNTDNQLHDIHVFNDPKKLSPTEEKNYLEKFKALISELIINQSNYINISHSKNTFEGDHLLIEKFRQLLATSTETQKKMIRKIIRGYQYALEHEDFIRKKAEFYPAQFENFNQSQQDEFLALFIKVQAYLSKAYHAQQTAKSIKLADDLEKSFTKLLIVAHLSKSQIETVFENLHFCTLLHKIDLFENETKIKLKALNLKQLEFIHDLLV